MPTTARYRHGVHRTWRLPRLQRWPLRPYSFAFLPILRDMRHVHALLFFSYAARTKGGEEGMAWSGVIPHMFSTSDIRAAHYYVPAIACMNCRRPFPVPTFQQALVTTACQRRGQSDRVPSRCTRGETVHEGDEATDHRASDKCIALAQRELVRDLACRNCASTS